MTSDALSGDPDDSPLIRPAHLKKNEISTPARYFTPLVLFRLLLADERDRRRSFCRIG